MKRKLTAEQLDIMEREARIAGIYEDWCLSMVAELRERRAADLTADDKETLLGVRRLVRLDLLKRDDKAPNAILPDGERAPYLKALATIDRLVKS